MLRNGDISPRAREMLDMAMGPDKSDAIRKVADDNPYRTSKFGEKNVAGKEGDLLEMANRQRGPAERAMEEWTMFAPGRIGEYGGKGDNYGYGSVMEKVDNGLNQFKSGRDPHSQSWTYQKEIDESLKHKRESIPDFDARNEKLRQNYIQKHGEVPVYNEPQWLSREAAIAAAKGDDIRAEAYLDAVRKIGKTPKAWEKANQAHTKGFDFKGGDEIVENYKKKVDRFTKRVSSQEPLYKRKEATKARKIDELQKRKDEWEGPRDAEYWEVYEELDKLKYD